MIVVHVHVHVKAGLTDAFMRATVRNAVESVKEPGIARFDVVRMVDDDARFVLVEAYRSADAVVAHKATPHYAAWRDEVADMMAEPRSSVKLTNVFPPDSDW